MVDSSTYSVEAQHQRNISSLSLMISGANLDLSHVTTSRGRWPLSALLGTCRMFWSRNMWITPWTRRQRSCDVTVSLITLLAQFVWLFVELCPLTHTHTHTHTHKEGSIFRVISFFVCLVFLVLSCFIFFITVHWLFNFPFPFLCLHWQAVNFQNVAKL
jgi:hypothetical protein